MGMSPPSFGRPRGQPQVPPLPDVPVISLGQVHAELVLTVSEDSLRELGVKVANEIANAVAHGYVAGWQAAQEATLGETPPDLTSAAGEASPQPPVPR